MTNSVYFANIDQALMWFMEQKRKQYLIKTSSVYSDGYENTSRQLTVSELLKWSGIVKKPESKEEKAMVCKVFHDVLKNLSKKTQVVLVLTYLGDFATPELYEKAKKSQKILKEQGFRTVMQYKYPQTKVAKMLNVDRRTVYRHLQTAKDCFAEQLIKQGVLYAM